MSAAANVHPLPVPSRELLWREVVGEVLRAERASQRRTLKDVADSARISLAYLSEIERGRKEVSSEVLAAATGALGISLADVVDAARHRLPGAHAVTNLAA